MTRAALPLFDGVIETPFERRFQGRFRQGWRARRWHVMVAEPGSGKTRGICDLRDEASRQAGTIGGRRSPVLAVAAPNNDPREAAVGNFLVTALGLSARGRWRERTYLLFEVLVQDGVACLVIDDAHDLCRPHLIFLQELTDQLLFSFPSQTPLGLCFVAAGLPSRSRMSLTKKTTMWMQFRRRLDPVHPECRIASHTEAQVRDSLLALEQMYRSSFPALNLQQGTGSIYPWLPHPLLDPQKSGRVSMDHLLKLVTTARQWSYLQGERDVNPKHLDAAAAALTLRRDTIHLGAAGGGNAAGKDQKEKQSKTPPPK